MPHDLMTAEEAGLLLAAVPEWAAMDEAGEAARIAGDLTHDGWHEAVAAALSSGPRALRTVVAMHADVARLTAEVEEARLELAAERGEQEGASGLTLPWRYVGVVWRVDLRDRRMVLRAQRDGWEILRERGRGWSGACSSIRAAMRAAEAALAEVPRG